MEEQVKLAIQKYLEEQKPENFIALREAYIKSPDYTPYSEWKATAYPLLDEEKFKEAEEFLITIMASRYYNPGIHKLMAYLMNKSGKTEMAYYEDQVALIMMQGILSSGDGSIENPYLVLSIDDEYDVINYLTLKVVKQELRANGDRHLDILECEDGKKLHFDITAPFSSMKS